ncbi:MAG: MjaI family restriction endonuclease [Thermoplasmata archaeon]|nr:MjaI family restriction endonuclease [Thermoplasmata archaeon]
MEFKIKVEEIRRLMEIDTPEFPKYATQIMNLANQNAQATRPKVVGQMSELIKEFTGRSLEEWEDWYLKRYPDSIDRATKKILEMINNFRDVISQIDENMIRQWVRDLVIVKTFIGLRFQEAVLKKIAEKFGTGYRLSTPEEESKGIDGYIGEIPISLKPITYQSKKMLTEKIEVDIIYYEKQKDGLKITIPEELEKKLGQIEEAGSN